MGDYIGVIVHIAEQRLDDFRDMISNETTAMRELNPRVSQWEKRKTEGQKIFQDDYETKALYLIITLACAIDPQMGVTKILDRLDSD